MQPASGFQPQATSLQCRCAIALGLGSAVKHVETPSIESRTFGVPEDMAVIMSKENLNDLMSFFSQSCKAHHAKRQKISQIQRALKTCLQSSTQTNSIVRFSLGLVCPMALWFRCQCVFKTERLWQFGQWESKHLPRSLVHFFHSAGVNQSTPHMFRLVGI